MNELIKNALSLVASRLAELPKDEFRKKLDQNADSELAYALLEKASFVDYIGINLVKEIVMKTASPNFPSREIGYSTEINCAANDDSYLMAA